MAEIRGNVNEFVITGRIINSRKRNNGSTTITVISRNGGDIYVHIQCRKGMLPEFENRTHVKVEGHIETANHMDSNKNLQHTQTFVADNVILDQTMSEDRFGIRGKFYLPPSCTIYLKGRINKVLDSGNWIRYQIEDGMGNYIRSSMKKLDRQPEINPGDEVCIVGSLSTNRKEIKGRKATFEDIIVMDIGKVSA